MARSRRELRQNADIWPGFVDALATLLLVIIFLLVVFVLAQFFLNQLLQGQDTKLQNLEQAIAELTEQLDLEQASSAELRLSVARLTSDLQAAQAAREDAEGLLAQTETERDEFRDQLFLLEDEKALLTQTLNEMRQEADRGEELQAELDRSVDLRARLQEELERARRSVTANEETIETQLAQLIQLRRDIDALEKARADLETQVTEMAALLQAAEVAKGEATQEIARLSDLLETARQEQEAGDRQVADLRSRIETERDQRGSLEAELARLTDLLRSTQEQNEDREQRVAELSDQLEQARDERSEREARIAALVAQLEAARSGREETAATAEELRQARERLMLELTQARDRSEELEARLSSEEERTALAQRQLDDRDVRIAELLRSAGRTEEALATEQTLSREALNQVEILNRQINALRVQLAALEQALDLEQQKVEEQQVTIADLGSKLNMALAGRVEELSRFRSEFFGRLRQVLGERPDVRIVGDRFVFQSEVLFPSASDQIQPGGRDELRKLADSLKDIAAEIPTDLPWVLQINGHTDRRPISTPDFPSNWELSTARATNVAKFLISQGIPAERLAAAGFAQYQPLDDRNDEIAYRRNRRIEIKLTNP
jgi:chemotaxis protein MotB